MEVEITTHGESTHGSQPDRGVNAIYGMSPMVSAVERMHGNLEPSHPWLGAGSVAVTAISSRSPSLTAIPDECTIHLDRRLTIGETAEQALAQLEQLPEIQAADAEVHSHSVNDQIPLAQLEPAISFYAMFPEVYLKVSENSGE